MHTGKKTTANSADPYLNMELDFIHYLEMKTLMIL